MQLRFLLVVFCGVIAVALAANMRKYDLIEHKQLGGGDLDETVTPSLILDTKASSDSPKDERLTFGDMTAFVGDFFGPKRPDRVICKGNNRGIESNAESVVGRFNLLKGDLVEASKKRGFAKAYYGQLKKEEAAVGLKNGKGTVAYSDDVRPKIEKEQWDLKYVFYSAEADMLKNNDDHFGPCAKITIAKIVESWGIKPAANIQSKLAKPNDKPLSVSKFIVTDGEKYVSPERRVDMAILSHFWTDQLAGGHVRTPRHALRRLCGNIPGGFMTNAMHNEDNYNGVPVTVTLPFRKEDRSIVVQKQSLKVLGDGNYWTPGNEAKDRLVGFWRYVDNEMLSYVNIKDAIPTWDRESDDQTCPMFYVENEYSHDDKTGDFNDVDVPVRVRLNFLPLECGMEQFASHMMFLSKNDVMSVKLKTKCCYFTMLEKSHCRMLVPALLRKARNTKVVKSDDQGNIDNRMNKVDGTYVSRYWSFVMSRIRKWKRSDLLKGVSGKEEITEDNGETVEIVEEEGGDDKKGDDKKGDNKKKF